MIIIRCLLTILVILTIPFNAEAQSGNNLPSASKKSEPNAVAVKASYGKYDFSFTSLEGKQVRLSDYAGKVVLVNIWAPWCGPCKFETPGFVKLYEQYRSKGFEIVGVAVKTNEKDVRSFVVRYNVPWPNGIKDEVANAYGTYGLPDNYLFNPDGSVAKHFFGYTKEEVLRPEIEAALKRTATLPTK